VPSETGFFCPVCGYAGLHELPWVGSAASDEICPCCGTHFGLDDFVSGNAKLRPATYERLRRAWIDGGYVWFSRSTPPPLGWSPREQLDLASRR
jgi:hypothetical protein